jgi:TonB family protein
LQWPICFGVLFFLLLELPRALLHAADGTDLAVAIDARGKRYRLRDYERRPAPWREDTVATVTPLYPVPALTFKQTGTGLFRLLIDADAGRVRDVRVLKSTGFKGLDASAVTALRQWRWKPRKWKQVDMPVTFTLPQRDRQPSSDVFGGRALPSFPPPGVTP